VELVPCFVKRRRPTNLTKLTIRREKRPQTFGSIIFCRKAHLAASFLGTTIAEEAALRAVGVVSRFIHSLAVRLDLTKD
jgi:hypothetical protein